MRLLALLTLGVLPLAFAPACRSNGGPGTPPPARTDAPPPADDPGDGGAGFADPGQTDDPPRDPPPAVSPELAEKIRRTFGERCRYERACGDMIGVDCDAAVDGPYYYVRRDSLEIVSTCGGACMRGCTDCPPKAWTCPTY